MILQKFPNHRVAFHNDSSLIFCSVSYDGKPSTSHRKSSGRGRRMKCSFSNMNGYITSHILAVLIWTLVICVLPMYSLASIVPEISDFTADQRRYFIDNSNSEAFFHHLSIDPYNASSIYIGALDFVYRLNADNINITFQRSENITNFSNFSKIYKSAVDACRKSFVPKSHPDYQCRNHIRGILPQFNNKEIYICATGSYSPQDFYLDKRTLRVLRIGYDSSDPDGAGSGFTKCPYDPDTNHTIIYVGENHGIPNNYSAIYTSLLAGAGSKYAIYRLALQKDQFSRVEFNSLQSEFGPDLGELYYVASFEIDQYIYFFFRELALEASSVHHIHYARVARVCKNDNGGPLKRNLFLTYVKARLNCSVGTDDIPVYFNELYDVVYDSVSRVFYGLFMANVNGMWGSAVCQFNYTTIRENFDYGSFFAQEKTNSPWTVTSDEIVPKPRPSLCQSSNTSLLSLNVQSFALTKTLMHGTVDQMTRSPLYYTHDVAYSHLAVDVVLQFTVLYLYSVAVPNEIVRVVKWTDANQQVQSRKFAVLKPFGSVMAPTLWDMKIHSSNGQKWLYVVTEEAVIQLSMDLCSSYKLCTDCVKDPYCGWNLYSSRCENFQKRGSTSLIQGVSDISSLKVCQSGCTLKTETKSLPGMAVHLQCQSYCSPENAVTWTLQKSGTSVQTTVPVLSDPNYVLSLNNGLVVLNVSRHHIGTFRCISNGITLAEHNITTSACEYGEDVREIWIREFVNWCKAFDHYQSEYNKWLCLKEKCIKNSCISNEAINSCSKKRLQ